MKVTSFWQKFRIFLLVGLLGIAAALVLSEIILALFVPQETFKRLYRNANRCWQKDEKMPFTLKPNCHYQLKTADFEQDIQINSQGFRGKEVSVPKPKDVTRIIVTGDSFIFGNGVGEDKTVSAHLQEFLNRNKVFGGNNVEVVNAGFLGGFSPDGHLLNIRRMISQEYRPDIVIMAVFVFNEISDMDSNEWIGIADFSTPKKIKSKRFLITDDGLLINLESEMRGIYKTPILRNSHLAVFLSRSLPPIIDKVKNKFLGAKPYIPQSLEPTDSAFYGIQYEDCIFGQFCHRRFTHLFADLMAVFKAAKLEMSKVSAKDPNFLVLLIPVDFQIYPEAVANYGGAAAAWGIKNAHAESNPQPQKRFKEMLEKEGIAYLDLLEAFREKREPRKYYVEDGHWNAAGTKLAAEEIGKWIWENFR